jgi:hypothetical protein
MGLTWTQYQKCQAGKKVQFFKLKYFVNIGRMLQNFVYICKLSTLLQVFI